MSQPNGVQAEMLALLDQVLKLGGRSARFDGHTPLLGSLPELDSMAVVAVIQAIEQHFGIELADEDIDGTTFATVGSLVEFVSERLRA